MIHYSNSTICVITYDIIKYFTRRKNGYIEYESYIEYLKKINNYIPIIATALPGEDNHIGVGVNCLSYYAGLNNFAITNNISLSSIWNVSKDTLPLGIKGMLINDIPVPLLIGYGNNDTGVVLYKEVESVGNQRYVLCNESQKTYSHYVNITGLLEDYITGKTILEVSSWGERFYISYEDYIDFAERRSIGGYYTNNICLITAR